MCDVCTDFTNVIKVDDVKKKKKKDDKKKKAFYDWATTGIPVIKGKALGAYSDVMAKTEQQIVITKIILALGYG